MDMLEFNEQIKLLNEYTLTFQKREVKLAQPKLLLLLLDFFWSVVHVVTSHDQSTSRRIGTISRYFSSREILISQPSFERLDTRGRP